MNVSANETLFDQNHTYSKEEKNTICNELCDV